MREIGEFETKKSSHLFDYHRVISSLCHPFSRCQNVNPKVLARVKETFTVDGKVFKDLNSNGKLDDYENWELPVEKRVADLISQMTLEEKAGLLMIPEFEDIEGSKLEQPNNLIDYHARYFIYRKYLVLIQLPTQIINCKKGWREQD